MCAEHKQNLKAFIKALPFLVMISAANGADTDSAAMGAIAPGDSKAGITDRAFIVAPPNWSYAVERQRGSFLDCGEGMDMSQSDENGRGLTPLKCGVTLTETVVVPAASTSARIIVHF